MILPSGLSSKKIRTERLNAIEEQHPVQMVYLVLEGECFKSPRIDRDDPAVLRRNTLPV